MVDPLCVATQGFQAREDHQFELAVATLGWICLPVEVQGGGGRLFCWDDEQVDPCEELVVSARTIAVAIAVAIKGENDPLRIAASLALTVESDGDPEDGDPC